MYVYSMQPFDADDLMYGVILARDGFECHHPMEFEYYNTPKMVTTWFNANLCAYCAGSSGAQGIIDEHLSVEWKSVLPVCQPCYAKGYLPLARTRRRNGGANVRRAQRARVMGNTSPHAPSPEDADSHAGSSSGEGPLKLMIE